MTKNISQLQWACRRGMLELDVLLGNFLKEAYPSLSPSDQKDFEELLSSSDQDLFYWLTGKEVPLDAKNLKLVTMIQKHAKTRHKS